MKYYFFRDLEHKDNLEDGLTFHSAGLVEVLNTDIDTPLSSGKDMIVVFKNPFTGDVNRQYRTLVEVELFEVSEGSYEVLLYEISCS